MVDAVGDIVLDGAVGRGTDLGAVVGVAGGEERGDAAVEPVLGNAEDPAGLGGPPERALGVDVGDPGADVGGLLGSFEVFEGDYRKLFDSPATYEKVTREDVQKAAASIFNKNRRTVGVLQAPAAKEEAKP